MPRLARNQVRARTMRLGMMCCALFLVKFGLLPTTEAFVSQHGGLNSGFGMTRTRKKSHVCLSAHQHYLATCIPGLATVLAKELEELGASSVKTSGNTDVTFTNEDDPHVGLKALLWVRTAKMILELVAEGYNVETRQDLHNKICNSVNVKQLLGNGHGGLLTLSVKSIINGRVPKDVSHSRNTALTVNNALCDVVRDMRGYRPSVDVDNADVPLVCNLFASHDRADFTLWRSLSPPGSLHQRGYRIEGAIHEAAMKESLAAGLLLSSGWKDACKKEGVTLVDPMCDSGSLVLEAAMMAADIAPGLMRITCDMPGHATPPVVRWKSDNDISQVWKDLLVDATQRAKAGLHRLKQDNLHFHANVVHDGALDTLERSLARAGLSHVIKAHQYDCRDWNLPKDKPVWVVTNPPWGVRLSDDDHEAWESLRVFLRSNCPTGETRAWVSSGNKEHISVLHVCEGSGIQNGATAPDNNEEGIGTDKDPIVSSLASDERSILDYYEPMIEDTVNGENGDESNGKELSVPAGFAGKQVIEDAVNGEYGDKSNGEELSVPADSAAPFVASASSATPASGSTAAAKTQRNRRTRNVSAAKTRTRGSNSNSSARKRLTVAVSNGKFHTKKDAVEPHIEHKTILLEDQKKREKRNRKRKGKRAQKKMSEHLAVAKLEAKAAMQSIKAKEELLLARHRLREKGVPDREIDAVLPLAPEQAST